MHSGSHLSYMSHSRFSWSPTGILWKKPPQMNLTGPFLIISHPFPPTLVENPQKSDIPIRSHQSVTIHHSTPHYITSK